MVHTLESVIYDGHVNLSTADTKTFLQMILKGLAYIHRNGVLHRDLKPNNLLVAADGLLKLADFGSACVLGSSNCKLSHQVFARWYRAPELLYSTNRYTSAVDIWAAGCIFAELLLRRPFLQGTSDIDQLRKIFSAFGTPKLSECPDLVDCMQFQYAPAPPLGSLFPMATDDALDLLSKMFKYDPESRISAQQALNHRYFQSLPEPTMPSMLPRPHPSNKSSSPYGPICVEGGDLSEATSATGFGYNSGGNAANESYSPDGPIDIEGWYVSEGSESSATPMSMDMKAVLGSHSAPRPKLNSADSLHFSRKLSFDDD